MKKILAILLAAVLILGLLTACGEKPATDAETKPETTSETAQPDAEKPAEGQPEGEKPADGEAKPEGENPPTKPPLRRPPCPAARRSPSSPRPSPRTPEALRSP